VAEMLSGAIGGNVDLSPLAETSGEIITAKLGPFEPGQRALVMTGTTRGGETIKAVLILSPARPLVH
jgi:hypothetical protein